MNRSGHRRFGQPERRGSRRTCEEARLDVWETDRRGVLRELRETEDAKAKAREGNRASFTRWRTGSRSGNRAMGRAHDKLAFWATRRRGRGHDKLDGRRKRPARARSDKRNLRATVGGERGRDGSILWGTAGESTVAKTNSSRGRPGGESVARQTRRVAQPGGESVVGRAWGVEKSIAGARRDGLGPRATVDRERREDEFIVVYRHDEDVGVMRAAGRATETPNDREGSSDRVGNCASGDEAPNGIIARQRAVIRDHEHGGLERRLEISSRRRPSGDAKPALFGRDAEDEVDARSR